ncbi:MAG: DUF222 domain-containing protein [Actinobacteria bacterium]|nr:DUF222 domain-containing protein [Actinomycetota bacterium]
MTSPADLVRQLHDVADALLSTDVDALGSDELQALVVSLQAERSRLAVAAADVLHRWESCGGWRADGSLNASLALGRDTRSCHRAAKRELRRARLLERMVRTRAAVVAGRLSMDHVDLFVQYAAGARFELFLEHEQMLVEQCAGCELFDDARRVIQYWAVLADDLLGRAPSGTERSRVYASRSQISGRLLIDGDLDVVDAEIVEGELRRLIGELRHQDKTNGVARTLGELRAAALVRMATRSVNATGVTARPLFQVIIGDQTARRLCELASGHVLAPEQLIGHLDAAVVESFLFDGPTTVIAKTRQRTFTGALRRAVQVRDRRCQHQSVCPTPAVHGDVDHRTPAARGGATSQFNGRSLCTPHNRREDLRDHSDPLPEQRVDFLEAARCRARWTVLHGDWPPGTWDDE